VLSYDYRHFAADVAKADGYLTGKLRSDYDKLQRTSVGPTARQVHATVTATVQGTAVLAATKSSATVLVFVDQRSTNTRIAAPRLDENRVTMQLVRSGGRWLVSAFDAI
jgi:Mce-associated membrane protein